MSWINIGLAVLASSFTGSAAFAFWKAGSFFLEQKGMILGIRSGLYLVSFSFLVPVMVLLRLKSGTLLWGRYTELSIFGVPAVLLTAGFLFALWMGGMIFAVITHMAKKRKIRRLFCCGRTADWAAMETIRELRKNLCIRRNVYVYRVEGLKGPFVTGILRCRIFLPEKIYEEEEQIMILEHELWHFKQGDLLLKGACACIAWLFWFNPLTKTLLLEVDKWGDICCDRKMCYGRERSWDRKQYFRVVLENAPEDEMVCTGMQLSPSGGELKERMKKMKEYTPERELRRGVLVLLAACMILTGTAAFCAAERGVGALCRTVSEVSKRVSER